MRFLSRNVVTGILLGAALLFASPTALPAGASEECLHATCAPAPAPDAVLVPEPHQHSLDAPDGILPDEDTFTRVPLTGPLILIAALALLGGLLFVPLRDFIRRRRQL